MRRGTETRLSLLAGVVLLVAGTAVADKSVVAGWDFGLLMQMVAAAPPVRRSYEERKWLALLEVPIEARGWLEYLPPDTLIREIDGPPQMRFTIQGQVLSLEQEGLPLRVQSLQGHPAALALVATLRALIAGDGQRLKSLYNIDLDGDPAAWQLRLRPRDAAVAKQLASVEVTGSEGRIETVLTVEASGDRSLMVLGDD